ncbi:MFS transporter [Paenibacillus sp. D2_2]|uniref:MFS transporter n=1 Tax=Paenibacillus sp. D2_2 TaxID=3073092 RepID=UPI0028169D38|nr:MFS transporter [Paenibacillus sp. D2_2]WMT39003.1 MFS transporter [Paenibacillus sp. D2_2]
MKNVKSVSVMLPVVMLSLALALRQMSMTIVMPFISTYCKDLIGYTPLLAGLAVGIFGLTQAIFQIPYGVLSDKYGNKRMVLIGLVLVVVGLVLAFFSNNMALLIVSRALQGSGAIIGVAYSWSIGMVNEKDRTKAMSILGAFISVAAALAFAVGPLLREIMSVRWMFMTCAILLTLNLLYILFFLKDNKQHTKTQAAPKGTFRLLLQNKTFVTLNLAAFLNNFLMVSVFYALPLDLNKITGETGMWKIFVPAIIAAIIFMKAAVTWAEKSINNNYYVLIASFMISAVSIIFYFNKTSFLSLLAGTTLFMCAYISLTTLVAANVNSIAEDSYRGQRMEFLILSNS